MVDLGARKGYVGTENEAYDLGLFEDWGCREGQWDTGDDGVSIVKEIVMLSDFLVSFRFCGFQIQFHKEPSNQNLFY